MPRFIGDDGIRPAPGTIAVNTVAVSSSARVPFRVLQGWPLFSVLAIIAAAIELLAWQTIDWRSGSDVRYLIGFNWRLSAPYFLLTFSASALQRLFPSVLTRWLLANRRYLGLAFASVAGWQLISIVFLATHFRAELEDIHSDSFQYVEDLIFVTLVLMTITSFRPVSRHMRLATWKRLHSTGIYLLGGLFTVNFLYSAVNETSVTYLVIMSAFALAWGLRAAVWWQRRATFRDWKLFWALFGLTNAAVLGTWSYFGLQTDENLRHVTSVSATLACLFFLAAFVAPSLSRLWPTAASAQWLAGRRYYLLAGLLSMMWYLIFMAVRGGKPLTPGAPPLPLSAGVSAAVVAVVLLMLRFMRAGRGAAPDAIAQPDGSRPARRVLPLLLIALLIGGLVATRYQVLSVVLAIACVVACVVAGAGAVRGPGQGFAPRTSE